MHKIKESLLQTRFVLDNEYLDHYIDLMLCNINTQEIKGVTQKHHIIPVSYYKVNNITVNNSEDNLINLTYKDHVLAHYYLSLCCNGTLRRSMLNAFLMLSNFSPELNSDELDRYQELYEAWYKTRLGVSPGNKGIPMTQEQKDKISRTLMGHSVSEESRIKMRNAQLNMSPEKRQNIIDGNKNKNYKPTEETIAKQRASLQGHEVTEETRRKIGEGNSKKLRGGRWFNDGIKNIYVRPGDIPQKTWLRGKVKQNKQ